MNEEGLPIIDITEPLNEKPSQSTEPPLPPATTIEEPFIPLSSLPPSARARRNDQVKRILDYLEEEEHQEELKEKQREFQDRNDMLQKQKLLDEKEKANIKATKELQKKMGRALLQNIGKAKEKERQEQEAQRLLDEAADKNRSPSLKKKTVAFVDTLDNSKDDTIETPEPSDAPDWGDVTLARLRASKRPTLLSQSLLDKHPMKMSVVERFPSGLPTLPNSPHPRQNFADSDDESDPAPESDSSDTVAGDEDDSESIVEQDEVDIDFAQHQRQIALEYHDKRSRFGQDAAEAIMNPSFTDDAPLVKKQQNFLFNFSSNLVLLSLQEPTPGATRESSKPVVSHFRANRIASSYNASMPTASTSLGASIVPASSSRTIQHALRMGTLDPDGRLVGGEVDSASEDEDPALQEVLELLKKGEVYNLGPDGNYIHTIPPPSAPTPTSTATPSPMQQEPSATKFLPPPSRRSQTSKFKASRPSDPIPIPTPSPISVYESLSPSPTPISHDPRSSPKLDAPQATAIAPQVYERQPLSAPASSSTLPFSLIVDSPSFPAASQQGGGRRPAVPPTVLPSSSVPSTRPDRPPAILSSAEPHSNISQTPQSNEISQQEAAKPEKKVSRFKAERL